MRRLILASLALCALAAALSPATHAQSRTQTARAFVQAPSVLGHGGATAALAHRHTAFFYNPAHLASKTSDRARITVLGVRASMSTNVLAQYAFFRDDLQPAIERGFENMSGEELKALYDEALRLGRRRSLLSGNVQLPTLTLRTGPVGLGGGLFIHSSTQYHVRNGGAGVPAIDLVAQLDGMAVAGAAFDAGAFNIGVTGKYTRRYLTVKRKPIDAIEQDEGVYVLAGESFGLDVGLLFDLNLPLPGRLAFGAAVYDALATEFNYTYARNLTQNGPPDEAAVAREEALANERYDLARSFRFGLAYTLSVADGPFTQTSFALDYVGYSDPRIEQTPLAHLHFGAETSLARVLTLRLGLSQGYPTGGIGLNAGFMTLDYAIYGVEEGRTPGRRPRWTHTVQVTLGPF